MEVNNKLIQDIAKLSKLKFDDFAEEKMKVDLEKMLAFVEKLNEIDTKDVDPLIYISEEINVLRKDNVTEETSQEDALKNAPEKDSDYFKVPTVLKK